MELDRVCKTRPLAPPILSLQSGRQRFAKQRVQDAGQNQTAGALYKVRGHACKGGSRSIDEKLEQEVAAGYCCYVDYTAGSHRYVGIGALLYHAVIQAACQIGHHPFNKKGNGHVDKVSAQKVSHTGAGACCQEGAYRVQKNSAQNHDCIARMYVSACTWSGDTD